MNGRAYAGAMAPSPAERGGGSAGGGPAVLAWNVEQFPAGTYPEMPTAAAAAVSPVVPTAAPPDPYGRCWQSQVDPGACFPYFGTLYGSSLPPPSYRMQPGCVSNMGQFWPPTPPPEGCVRYDGANNLHYCSPLTPVFRHGETLPQNMLGVHQRLSHYSHLIDMNKDSGLKRLDSCTESRHRQKSALVSALKHGKESQQQSHHPHQQQQRLCHCYECNEKCASSRSTTTQSVNKENISSQSKLLEQRFSEERLKTSRSKKIKSDCYNASRNAAQPNGSAINGYVCSVNQNVKNNGLVQFPNFVGNSSQKVESAQVTSSSYPQYDFIRPDSRPMHHNNRCSSNSLMTIESSRDVSVTASEAKTSDQIGRFENPADRSQHKTHVSTSCYASCVCAPVQTTSSSSKSQHSSDSSCCFSPPCMTSRTLYSNYPESSGHSKTPNTFVVYGNGYNASPLKNVYFSYYESENFDQASSSERKHGRDSLGKVDRISNCSDSRLTSVAANNAREYAAPSIGSGRSSCSFGMTANGRNQYGNNMVPNISNSYQYSVSAEQQKSANVSRYSSSQCSKQTDDATSYCERLTKVGAALIKQEKVDSPDCKYQRSRTSNSNISSSRCQPSPVNAATSGVLNLSTSVRCPKIEPQDDITNVTSVSEQFIAAASPMQSSPSNFTYSNASIKDIAPKTAQAACPEELEYSETERRYIINASAASSPAKCQVPGASSSLQMQNMENECAPAVPEDIVSVIQVEPMSGADSAVLNEIPVTGCEAPVEAAQEMSSSQKSLDDEPVTDTALDNSIHSELPDLSQSIADDENSNEPPSLCEQVYDSRDEIRVCEEQSDSMDDLPPKLEQLCDPPPPATSCSNKPTVASLRKQIQIDSEPSNACNNQKEESKISAESDKVACEKVSSASLKKENEEITKSSDIKEFRNASSSVTTSSSTGDSSTTVNECHGLYLLLEGIEHRKGNKDVSKCKILNNDEILEKSQDEEEDMSNASLAPEVAHSGKKLNVLCAFVEQQFAAEFGNNLRITSPSLADQHENQPTLISNYPALKTENNATMDSSSTSEPPCDVSASKSSASLNSQDETPEQEMRKKLAELQQKYKEKQKELARLRPKRIKTSSGLDSQLLDVSPASNSSSCYSLLCSKEESMSSAAEYSPEKLVSQPELMSCRFGNHSSTSGIAGTTSNSKTKSLGRKDPSKHLMLKFSMEQSHHEKRVRSGKSMFPRGRTITKRKSKLKSEKHSNKSLCSRRSSFVKDCINNSQEDSLEISRRMFAGGTKSRLSSECSEPPTSSSEDPKFLRMVKNSSGKRKPSKSKESKINNEGITEFNGTKNKQKLAGEIFGNHSASSMVGKLPKKRKSEHPQRYMPSKQVRLTETIVTKQLRNRILFESSAFGENDQKQYEFPEELSDALRKCHLSEANDSCSRKSFESHKSSLSSTEKRRNKSVGDFSEGGTHLKMSLEHLVENKRILAMEDGLFYAGCIREIQSPETYAISLDGQRGNKRHMFSREEMLLQTILEVKPETLSDLPEGTRVCAYWSHQYRCLYPGTVMKAPTPSADWSEPRVFVEFDDGDSAQIAMKNIRFLPPDIALMTDEDKANHSEIPSFMTSRNELSIESKKGNNRKRRKVSTKELRKHSRTTKNDKEDDSGMEMHKGFIKMEISENANQNGVERGLKKTIRHQAKKKQDGKGKPKDGSGSSSEKKKHKKYKGHKHHHHHRHHHHRRKHCHHHRHCKKHRHHKRASNIDNIINVVIPSTGIPLGDLIANKPTRSSVKEAETQCVGHSRNDKLPQIVTQSAADQDGFIQCKKEGSR